ncbi:alanine--glyoxylate aminotransferase family protein [Thermosulfuriphilus ammonigenes]|uniref:Alanine--glyoxylate aminotransferase family protein n=1 Tax=Thermosulfuriphilus ammonigenes TaxID=1936021 RepID=A0A6G7PW62_9BACT|nr:alanine--glyoxylate aminotransferase family protein [Thermosulfuriphilus ammonigenes]MBA2847985.1 aspartate aminotransferase-like enzyme [Thermosulfuriphilus ammonigenes]QIJ71827.1 alanine--glyoxylate aminotransferase family protein [Thermosulfuriphilus ammonigenes]
MDLLDKRRLLAPGPVPVPPKALLAMAQPTMHHRSPQFSEILSDVREGLKFLYQTEDPVLIFASSGTGAMEASVANLLNPGDEAICVVGGKFGERWVEICQAFGVRAVPIEVEWGRAVEPEQVEATLKRHPLARAVFVQAHETSTGVKHPVKELADLVRERETLLVVDAISALGVYDLPVGAWGLDVVVAGSQKGFALPPGLSFVSLSSRAREAMEKATLPRYYFDFRRELKAYARSTTAYTPAVSLILGLKSVLDRLRQVGLERLFAHHRCLSEATKKAMEALGLELFSQAPCETVTVVRVPEGVDGLELVKRLREKYGLTIAGGQAQLKGRIFRIAHMGYQNHFDVILAVAGVEMVLSELGYKVELGRGVAAAQEYFLKEGIS